MKFRNTLMAGTAMAIAVTATSAQAQGPVDDTEILVTARKRDETAISVPVALTAVSAAELSRRAITSMDGLARTVPTLIVGENAGIQGGIVAIRGLAGGDNNAFGDQAVSFNIDGVQVARSSIRRLSEMDLAQIEVLKGPQALFFGKNSPGGIISIRTADPTSSLSAKLSAGYEFNAKQIRTEGYISGPIGETLGYRIAGYYSDMKGFAKSIVPREGGPGIFPPRHSRAPNTTDYAGRLTLKWEPSDVFDARLKFTYGRVKGASIHANSQLVACPAGAPQAGAPADDCRPDDRVGTGDFGPLFGLADSRFGDGHSFSHQRQILAGLELNYHLSDTITLTSVTGYYDSTATNVANVTSAYLDTGVLPKQLLPNYSLLTLRETTEELRLQSDFDGPVNFTIGGLYQDSRARNEVVTYRNALAPVFVNNYDLVQKGTAYSLFMQSTVDILPTLEFSVGGRYSHEQKRLPRNFAASAAAPHTLVDISGPAIRRDVSFNNLSPETTLTFRPSQNLTVYASYKEGFLSGGFNTAPGIPTARNYYDQQTTKGFEGGIKAALLDGALRTNFTLYNYKSNGLQVSVTTAGTLVELRNAGSVRTKGAEFDFTYHTPLEGLTLNGGVAYAKGRYLDYQASCYRGQSSATCFTQFNRVTGQNALLQDLSGTVLVRSPTWTGNAGFNYEAPIGGLKLGLGGNVSHSGSYFADTVSSPGSRQRGYELFDANLRLMDADNAWELALIGRNLTDKFYFVRSTDVPFTGSAPGAALIGLRGDTGASVNRGREILLRMTVKFGD